MTLVNCAVVDNDRQLANPLPLSIFSENHSNCMMPAACVERGGELRQVGVPLTALDLLKLGEQEAPCVNLATVARCASSQATLALAEGRNPVIGHKRAHSERLSFVETEVSESTE